MVLGERGFRGFLISRVKNYGFGVKGGCKAVTWGGRVRDRDVDSDCRGLKMESLEGEVDPVAGDDRERKPDAILVLGDHVHLSACHLTNGVDEGVLWREVRRSRAPQPAK